MFVTFTNEKSGKTWRSDEDFGLVVSRVTIGAPPARTHYVEVPGRDGALDFSDYFGAAQYDDRKLTMETGLVIDDRYAQEDKIRNALHGERLRIILSDDAAHYFTGRVSVGELSKTAGIGKLTLTATCDPWRRKTQRTLVTAALAEEYAALTLTNERMPAIPTIRATVAATILFDDTEYAIEADREYRNTALMLSAGNNAISVKSTNGAAGQITFDYLEGKL